MWNKIKSLFSKAPVEPEDDTIYLVIWGVIDGPFTLYGDISAEDKQVPYYNLCKVSVSGNPEVFQTEIHFDSFESAYNMKRHFDKNIEPIMVPIGEI
jgi:hypothetical protein